MLDDNTLPTFFSAISLATGTFSETRSTVPKGLLLAWPVIKAEYKACAEYEGIWLQAGRFPEGRK